MRATPMQYSEFISSVEAQRRYWARSYLGWRRIGRAEPNAGHRALADLQAVGLTGVITQNVDGLHSAAGSRRVINLHGDIASVRCLDCGDRSARSQYKIGWRARTTTEEPLILGAAPRRGRCSPGLAAVQPGRLCALRRAAQTRRRVLRRVRTQATSRGSVRARGRCGDLGRIGLVADRDVRIAFRPAQREASATCGDHQSGSDAGRRACQPEDRLWLFGNADRATGDPPRTLVEHVSKHVADAAADVADTIADSAHEIADALADSGEHVAHATEQQAADQHA